MKCVCTENLKCIPERCIHHYFPLYYLSITSFVFLMVQLKDPYSWYDTDEEKQYCWRKPKVQSLSYSEICHRTLHCQITLKQPI